MQVSAPFASREFNGELLLEELEDLRDGQVRQNHLNDCATAASSLDGFRAPEAAVRLRQLAGGRFKRPPALAGLLLRWAARLKSEVDVIELTSHLRRLAITSAVVGALRRGSERLTARKEKR